MGISRISKVLAVTAALLAASGMANAAGKLNVITATQDLAAIGAEIGGDRITIEAIAKGYQDPHFVEPKPSFLLKLQKADLLVVVGLQLEMRDYFVSDPSRVPTSHTVTCLGSFTVTCFALPPPR